MLKAILTVPVIMAVAAGSVVLISKVGGKSAQKQIRDMLGYDKIKDEPSEQE